MDAEFTNLPVMSLSIGDIASTSLNIPVEPMEPSAPLYVLENTGDYPVQPTIRADDTAANTSTPCNPSEKEPPAVVRMKKVELELKKAQLKKEQLDKERKLMEEEFKARAMLLEAEIELALTKLDTIGVDKSEISHDKPQSIDQTAEKVDSASDTSYPILTQNSNSPNNMFAMNGPNMSSKPERPPVWVPVVTTALGESDFSHLKNKNKMILFEAISP